jgi:hypothetical protein
MPSIPFRPDFSCRVVVHDRHSPPHRQRNSNIRAAREPLSLRNRISASSRSGPGIDGLDFLESRDTDRGRSDFCLLRSLRASVMFYNTE